VRLVHGNDQPASLGVFLPNLDQLGIGVAKHGRKPLALEAQRSTKALIRLGPGKRIIARRRQVGTVGGHPLHVPAEPGKEHRTNDAAVFQRIAVAVFDVGNDLVVLVVNKRDRTSVTAEWCARKGQTFGCSLESRRHPVAPRTFLAGVVDLVENDEAPIGHGRERLGRRTHLLIRGDDAVDVGTDAIGGRPIGVEHQPKPFRRIGPLFLQVPRGGHDDQPAGEARQRQAGRRERKSGLSRTGRSDGKKVG